MCWNQYWRMLFGFQGYILDGLSMNRNMLQVNLRRDKRCRAKCPACGATMRINRSVWQMAKDLPVSSVRMVLIRYEALQGYCGACRCYSTVHPPGIDGHAKATSRLKRAVSQLCRYMPIVHVPSFLPVSEATAHRWDKQVLERELPEPNLDGIEVLLVDEKAVRKHYGYVTLVMNGQTGELLHMAEGKKKTSFGSFFDKLSAEQKQSIQVVAMDRNGAYRQVVLEQVPDAKIIYDKFHVIANFNDVLDRVRNEEYRKASHDDRAVIKGQRFNLYRVSFTAEQRRSLDALLAINENINIAHVLKGALRGLWSYKRIAWARKYLHHWTQWAEESAIPPLCKFAQSLRRDEDHIVNYCRYPYTIGKLEAFNNTVSRLIHRACGIKDLDYLYLKLRQESIGHVLQT